MTFDAQLRSGQIGEGYIAMWLRKRGWNVLPVYEKEIDTGKGPRLFMAEASRHKELIAPDLLAIKNGNFMWVEAKRKTRFSWYGNGNYWVTGIDKRHFSDYLQVRDETGIPIWLMFLHTEGVTWPNDVLRWGAPETCPTGLYGGEIKRLARPDAISHESDRHGPTGMLYWAYDTLQEMAQLDELIPKTRFNVVPYAQSHLGHGELAFAG